MRFDYGLDLFPLLVATLASLTCACWGIFWSCVAKV